MLDFFRITRGLEIDRTVQILQGSNLPGSSSDTISAPVGSLYLQTSGDALIKQNAGSGTDKWQVYATEAFVSALIQNTLSWREPVEVVDRISLTPPVAAPGNPIIVDGQSITDKQRVLFTAIAPGDPNIYIYDQALGTFSEDSNLQTQGDNTFVKRGTYTNRRFLYTGVAWLTYDSILKNVAIVQKDPGIDQFGAIDDALMYVASQTPSSVNPWLVIVYPGIYDEPTLTVPQYSAMISHAPSATIIVTNSPAQDAVIMQDKSGIRGFTISGASGAGQRGLVIQDVVDVLAVEMFFTNNDTDIHIDGNTSPVRAILDNISLSPSAARAYGLRVTSNGGNKTQCSLSNSVMDDTASTSTVHGLEFEGTGVLAVVTNVVANGNPAGSGHGVHIENGATVSSTGLIISDFALGLHVPNVGAPPVLRMNVQILASDLPNIDIQHPGTSGFISGAADHDEITVAPGTTGLNLAFNGTDNTDPGDVGFSIVGSLLLGSEQANLTDTTDLIQQASPTGVLSGGVLSVLSGLNIQVTAGYGYVVDSITMRGKRVFWNTTTVTVADNAQNYIYINNAGTPTFGPSLPDVTQTILLGRARTDSGSVAFLSKIPLVANASATFLDQFLRTAIGAIFGTGCTVTEDVTPFELDVTGGTYYYSKLTFNPAPAAPATFDLFYHVGGVFTTVTGQTVVDHTQYDNGTDLTPLTPTWFAKHAFYVAGDGAQQQYALVYSQQQYVSKLAAESGPLPTPPPFFQDIAVPIAAIIVEEGLGVTNISEIQDVRPRLGFTAPTVSGSIRHGDLLGLGNDDHLQYLLVNGTRAMSGNLNMGTNSITNINLIDGVDISAHGSRHGANSADPVPTAAPITSLSPSSLNAAGLADTLARSDHSHAITGFQPLDSDLTALAAIATTGLYVITGSGTSTTRSLVAPAAGITISNPDGVSGNPTFALANDLAALEALATTGVTVRTGVETWASRSLVQPGAGITISNADGTAGNPTFALANDLAALEGLASTGIAVRSSADTWVQRSIVGTANRISVSNGSGIAGDPTIDIAATYIGQTSITTLGTIIAGTWNGATIDLAHGGTGQTTGLRLNNIIAAAGTNSINNDDNAQTWNWSLSTAAKTALKISENVASTNGAGNQFLVEIDTIATSTAAPLRVQSKGNNSLLIDPNQNVILGSAALATNVTDGFLYITSMAGIPSGVPTSFTGRVPVVYDTSNNRIDVYNSGWKSFYANGPSFVQRFTFQADQFDNPVTADWAVNALAPASADTVNSALTVRRFDDTAEEGVGGLFTVPPGATNIVFYFKGRGQTAPAGTRTVGLKFYKRVITDNAAIAAWTSVVLTDISIPTNANFQYSSQTVSLATLSIAVGNIVQFELTRIAPTGGSNLVGDWDLLEMIMEFTT